MSNRDHLAAARMMTALPPCGSSNKHYKAQTPAGPAAGLSVILGVWLGPDGWEVFVQRLILGLILAGLVWAIGLAAFIGALPAPASGTPPGVSGIVVYTGGGGVRIKAGMEIFANGAGERLLISGVHPNTSREHLSKLWGGAPDLFECCVDLGHEALSTEGNASEAGGWADEYGFDRFVLVTSEYHMPRALAVTKAQAPVIMIEPYAVSSGYLDADGRPVSLEAWKELAGEYTKFILARIKSLFSKFGL